MRNELTCTLAALAGLGVAGCGDDAGDTAVKTVTVTVTAPATTTPSTAQSSGTSASRTTGTDAGPVLPEGVVGIDGRYALRFKKSQNSGETISTRFAYYFEPSRPARDGGGGRAGAPGGQAHRSVCHDDCTLRRQGSR